jgi:hypothetical protein
MITISSDAYLTDIDLSKLVANGGDCYEVQMCVSNSKNFVFEFDSNSGLLSIVVMEGEKNNVRKTVWIGGIPKGICFGVCFFLSVDKYM